MCTGGPRLTCCDATLVRLGLLGPIFGPALCTPFIDLKGLPVSVSAVVIRRGGVLFRGQASRHGCGVFRVGADGVGGWLHHRIFMPPGAPRRHVDVLFFRFFFLLRINQSQCGRAARRDGRCVLNPRYARAAVSPVPHHRRNIASTRVLRVGRGEMCRCRRRRRSGREGEAGEHQVGRSSHPTNATACSVAQADATRWRDRPTGSTLTRRGQNGAYELGRGWS